MSDFVAGPTDPLSTSEGISSSDAISESDLATTDASATSDPATITSGSATAESSGTFFQTATDSFSSQIDSSLTNSLITATGASRTGAQSSTFRTSFTTISGSVVPLPVATDANGVLVTANDANDSGSGLSTGATIGIAVGVPVGVIALTALATFGAFKIFGKPAFLKKLFGKSGHGKGRGGHENLIDDGFPSYKPAGQGPATQDPYRGWTTDTPQMTQTNPGHIVNNNNNNLSPNKHPKKTQSSVIQHASEALQNHALSSAQQQLSAMNPFQTANPGMDPASTAAQQSAAGQSAPGQYGNGQQGPGQSGPTGIEQQFSLDQLSPSQLQQYGLDQIPLDQLQQMGLDNLSLDQLQQLDWDLSQFDPTNSANNNQGPDFDFDRDDIDKLRRYIGKLRNKLERRRRRQQSEQDMYYAPGQSPSF
ncbi:hypothetical protein DV454_000668 [Geotrichum candidum]|nr:hypothetical protein DV454_000668 [Geotrichum candidum]